MGTILPRASSGPCDIYQAGGTPCIAAHSSVRALYGAFNSPLYQVYRNSDGKTIDIKPLVAGGVADAGAQDAFCAGSTCLISILYDQSGTGNHLTRAPGGPVFPGPEADGSDNLSSAVGAPVSVGGKKAYGVFTSPGTGYRNNKAKKTALGDDAEGMYAILDGTHYNNGCCFDYGNAEPSVLDTGTGHMETIYFGDSSAYGTGSGKGPWIMADLEKGLFSGLSPTNNPANPSITDRFVTAIVKGEPNHWAIRGGNAAAGGLTSYYNGARPAKSGYNPLHKEGAIVLGVGGDNSKVAQGTFYEGVMTTGYPSDATENAVQANIVAAGYKVYPFDGPKLSVSSTISLRVTTPGYDNRYITHTGADVNTQVGGGSNKADANWIVRTGLANSDCYSFESTNTPGSFLRHRQYKLQVAANDGSKQLREDATFCTEAGLGKTGTIALRSWGFPTRYFRHHDSILYIASQGGVHEFDQTRAFIDDISFVVGKAL